MAGLRPEAGTSTDHEDATSGNSAEYALPNPGVAAHGEDVRTELQHGRVVARAGPVRTVNA